MKNTILKLTMVLLTCTLSITTALAQSPQKISYQAVIRDANNSLTTNQAVGMQISILQGSATGTPVYVETQTPTTNANGLVSLEIGTGTLVSGDFTTIDWANDTYFIKTETDPTGGTTYTITGTTQLMSVPYALHAKTAETITGTVNYTETDPVYGASIAGGITATDTANWNNHIVDTDTQLDSTGVATLGYVAGAHTIDTDTQLDSIGVENLGFVAGAHTIDTDTQLDSTSIATLGFVAGVHTVNTDTQLDSAGVASLGYVADAHTIDTDTQLDSTGVAGLGYVAGAHTIDTDTQLDSTDIATLGYVAGAHTVDTDTQLDSTGIATLGYVAGAHTINTDTQLDSAGVAALGFVAGAHTFNTDTQLDSTDIATLGFVAGAHTINTNTQLDSAGVASLGYVAGTPTLSVSPTGDTLTIEGGNSVLVPGISLLNFPPPPPPPPPSIGDFRDGGVVFWIDGTGQHGLVADVSDLSASDDWGCFGAALAGADGSAIGTGAQNTLDIITACPTYNTATQRCVSSTKNGYTDWFLPSIDELTEIYNNRVIINTTALANSGAAFNTSTVYWSSTEYSNYRALSVFFYNGNTYDKGKNDDYSVRAIRAF